MTKILFCFLVMLSTSMVMAQNLRTVNKAIPFPTTSASTGLTVVPESTTLNCVDTLDFAIAKATGLQALELNNVTSAEAASQYFNAPQAITISGATFFAYKSDTTGGISVNIPVSIYLAGTDSLPTGAPLVTGNVTVDTTFGTGALAIIQKEVTFSTPLTMTQPYCVVIENSTPNSMVLIYNSYTNGDGAQNWLSGANIAGTWLNSYVINIGTSLLDADVLVYPHVSYDLTSSFTSSRSHMCMAGDVTFTDASSAILEDPMYNRAAFFDILALSYSYNFGDGSPNAYGADTTYTYSTTPPYTVIQYDTIIGWRTFCAATDTFDIGSAVAPSVTATSLPVSCNGLFDGEATAVGSGGTGGYTYIWDAAAGAQTTDIAIGLAAGVYEVTVVDSLSCSSSVAITVMEPSMLTSTITDNGDGTAVVSAVGGTSGYTYQWDAAASNQTTAIATGLMDNTVYSVTVTDGNGCTSVSTVTVIIVGVNQIDFLNDLSIFPVPASTKVFVDLDMNQTEEVSIRILNVTGQTVLEQNLGAIQSQKIELNTAEIAAGIYMINFNIGAESITKKLIIE